MSALAVTSAAASLQRDGRRRGLAWALGGAVVAVMLGSVAVGSYLIGVDEVVVALASRFGGPAASVRAEALVWDIRLPRVLLAATVGAALATSGAGFQGVFRNPLVEPFILGVSGGAAFGAGVAVVLRLPVAIAPLAFAGALLAVGCTYWLSSVRGQRPTVALVIAGVTVGSVFSALFGLAQYLGSTEQLHRLVFWIMGGFHQTSWLDVAIVAPLIVLLVALLAVRGWTINVLGLGDAQARALGIDAARERRWIILLATALTALSVSVSGIVAWVGLLVPHAARMLVGHDNRRVMVTSALLGAIFLLVCDDLARTISTGEIPLGIMTSLIGAPYLIYLLRTRGVAMAGVS